MGSLLLVVTLETSLAGRLETGRASGCETGFDVLEAPGVGGSFPVRVELRHQVGDCGAVAPGDLALGEGDRLAGFLFQGNAGDEGFGLAHGRLRWLAGQERPTQHPTTPCCRTQALQRSEDAGLGCVERRFAGTAYVPARGRAFLLV